MLNMGGILIFDLRIQLLIISQVGVVLKSCSDTVPEGARTGGSETTVSMGSGPRSVV